MAKSPVRAALGASTRSAGTGRASRPISRGSRPSCHSPSMKRRSCGLWHRCRSSHGAAELLVDRPSSSSSCDLGRVRPRHGQVGAPQRAAGAAHLVPRLLPPATGSRSSTATSSTPRRISSARRRGPRCPPTISVRALRSRAAPVGEALTQPVATLRVGADPAALQLVGAGLQADDGHGRQQATPPHDLAPRRAQRRIIQRLPWNRLCQGHWQCPLRAGAAGGGGGGPAPFGLRNA